MAPMPRYAAAALLLATGADALWRDDVKKDKLTSPPYPTPDDWTYNTINSPAGYKEGKINVHMVPHTHDDTGETDATAPTNGCHCTHEVSSR